MYHSFLMTIIALASLLACPVVYLKSKYQLFVTRSNPNQLINREKSDAKTLVDYRLFFYFAHHGQFERRLANNFAKFFFFQVLKRIRYDR